MPFLAALLPAVIGAGASLIGASSQASAAKSSAKVQAATAKENRALAEKSTSASLGDLDAALSDALGQYDQSSRESTAALDPYKSAGERSLSQIMGLLGLSTPEDNAGALSSFQTSPDYSFRVGEGQKALERSQNAGGNRFSGAAGKALIDYGQRAGAQEFGDYFSRLTGVATNGQNAATNITSTISNIGASRAAAMLGTASDKSRVRLGGLNAVTGANAQAGAATAGGITGSANAWSNGLNSISQIAGNTLGKLSTIGTKPTGGIPGLPWSQNQEWQ